MISIYTKQESLIMKSVKWFLFLCLFITVSARAESEFLLKTQPFKWNYRLFNGQVSVTVDITENHYLYEEQTKVILTELNGARTELFQKPVSVSYKDNLSGPYQIFPGGRQYKWIFEPKSESPYHIKVLFQGCRQDVLKTSALCFPVVKKEFTIGSSNNDSLTVKKMAKTEPISISQIASGESDNKAAEMIDNYFLSEIIARGGVWLYIAALVAGLLSTLTPCVLPMIPITIAVLGAGKEVGTRQAIGRSAFYVLGIIITFTAAATLAAVGGRCLGSDILGNQWMIGFFTFLLIALSFSMLGVYEVQLPYFIRMRLTRLGGHGWVGAFLMGCAGGGVAFPCTGPILTALLSIAALSGKPVFGSSLLAVYALGFGFPFFLAGTGLGKLKSGIYMNHFKSLLGISILVTAVYCAGMISSSVSDLLSTGGTLQRCFSLILMVAGFLMGAVHSDMYLMSKPGKYAKVLGAVFIAVGLIWNLTMADSELSALKWDANLDAAVKQGGSLGKPVLIDFTADWCPACKKMDVTTFVDHEVAEELTSKWVLVKIDCTVNSDEIETLQRKYAINGLPSLVVLDSSGEHLQTLTGYQPAKKLLGILREKRKQDTS